MSWIILNQNTEGKYFATMTQSIAIDVSASAVWKTISNFIGLTEWVEGAKKTEFLSKTKHGIGAARKISFADGSSVIEYAVGWQVGKQISYIATSGLPLSGYHATLSISQKEKTRLSWTSFLISASSDKKQFEDFLSSIESFYASSLKNLKAKLEKAS
ncbi:MAG: SRPBCC family protein [Candidatus Nitrosotenuis sp.]